MPSRPPLLVTRTRWSPNPRFLASDTVSVLNVLLTLLLVALEQNEQRRRTYAGSEDNEGQSINITEQIRHHVMFALGKHSSGSVTVNSAFRGRLNTFTITFVCLCKDKHALLHLTFINIQSCYGLLVFWPFECFVKPEFEPFKSLMWLILWRRENWGISCLGSQDSVGPVAEDCALCQRTARRDNLFSSNLDWITL